MSWKLQIPLSATMRWAIEVLWKRFTLQYTLTFRCTAPSFINTIRNFDNISTSNRALQTQWTSSENRRLRLTKLRLLSCPRDCIAFFVFLHWIQNPTIDHQKQVTAIHSSQAFPLHYIRFWPNRDGQQAFLNIFIAVAKKYQQEYAKCELALTKPWWWKAT